MRPPFLPDWMPTWLVVTNTIALESALLVAIYVVFVRGGSRRRTGAFLAAVLLLGLVEVLAGVEVGCAPRLRTRSFVDAIPGSEDRSGGPRTRTHRELGFAWYESPVLGRTIRRIICVRALCDPSDAGSEPFMREVDDFSPSADRGITYFGIRPGGCANWLWDDQESVEFEELWRLHERDLADPRERRAAWSAIDDWGRARRHMSLAVLTGERP